MQVIVKKADPDTTEYSMLCNGAGSMQHYGKLL